jgi:hypothetical protein
MRSSTVLEISAVLSSCNQKNEHFLLKAKYYVQEERKKNSAIPPFSMHAIQVRLKMQEPLGTGLWCQT